MTARTKFPEVISGGMGLLVSDYELVKQVSLAGSRLGVNVLAIVSLTAVAVGTARRMQLGDTNILRALETFPIHEVAQKIIDCYYISGGKNPDQPFKSVPMLSLDPPNDLIWLTVAAAYCEVWLAKEGHDGLVGANLLEKVQMPIIYTILGAMWAGVDYITMGAGLPVQMPDVIDSIVEKREISYKLEVGGKNIPQEFRMVFNLQESMRQFSAQSRRNVEALRPKRPKFLPIITLSAAGKILLTKTKGRLDGFIVEERIAGGHHAPPRGWKGELSQSGEPAYGPRDQVNYEEILQLGKPIWLAGGFSSPEKLQQAKLLGAQGIQSGSIIGLADESRFASVSKAYLRQQAYDGQLICAADPRISPSGYPFQVCHVPGSIWEKGVYEKRQRVCDVGYLRQLYWDDGQLYLRCPAENVSAYVRKKGNQEDTVGRGCLCNALFAAVELGQIRKNDYIEPPVFTLGKDVEFVHALMTHRDDSYNVEKVLRYLLGIA